MVPIDKIQRGAARYVDAEILPKMQGRDMWVTSSIATMGIAKLPALIKAYKDNPAVKALSIVSDDGTSIDINALIDSLKPAARRTSAQFNIPFGGSLELKESDLDSLKNYIMQA